VDLGKHGWLGILEVCGVEHDEHRGRSPHQDQDQSKAPVRGSRKRGRANPAEILSRLVFSIRTRAILFFESIVAFDGIVLESCICMDLDVANNVFLERGDSIIPGVCRRSLPYRCLGQLCFRVLNLLANLVRDVPLVELGIHGAAWLFPGARIKFTELQAKLGIFILNDWAKVELFKLLLKRI